MVPQSTLRRPTAPYGAYGACGADFFFSFSRPKKPTFSSAFTRRSLELALSAARMTTAHRVSTLLLLTAVAGLLLLASIERVLSVPDPYPVLLIARGQPSVNSASFGLPEQLAPSAQLAMLRAAQGQLRLQRLQLVQQRSW